MSLTINADEVVLDADQVGDLLLPLGGPYDPDAVVETARAVAELVRRLNHATFGRGSLRYPSQLYRVVGSINAAVWGLDQCLGQLATRLDAWAVDPALGHDQGDDLAAEAARLAAAQLRAAAGARSALTGPLETARALTSHLSYRD